MWTQITHWLTPPIFPDSNKTRSARLLNLILLLLAAAAITLTPLIYLLGSDGTTFRPFTLIVAIFVVAVSMGLLILTRQGQVRLASFIVTFTIFFIVTANLYQGGDVGRAGPTGFILVVAIAGALLGGRWAAIFTGLSGLSLGLIAYLQVAEQLPPRYTPSPLIDVAIYLGVIVLVGLLLRSTMNALNEALARGEATNFQLRSLRVSLEERVAARTLDITLAAEIGRRLAQQRNVDELLSETVSLIQSNFGLYHVQIYLTSADKKRLVLRAATGMAGSELIQRHHQLIIGSGSINGIAAAEKRPIISTNTLDDALFRPNALLPETRCEMAVPLLVGDNLMGTLNLQGSRINELTRENLPAFETLAGQLAIALANATLFTQIRQSQAQLTEQTRRLTRESWQEYLNAIDREERLGYTYSLQGATPELVDALQTIENSLFVTQIKVLGEPMGTIQIENAPNQQWDADNAQIVQAVADQVAQQIENLRLLDEAERFHMEAEQANQRLIRDSWQSFEETNKPPTVHYDNVQVRALAEPEMYEETADVSHPIQLRGQTIGSVNLVGLSQNDEDKAQVITTITEALSTHIENLRLSQTTQAALTQTEEQTVRLSRLNDMATAISAAPTLADVLQVTATRINEIFGEDYACLALLKSDQRILRIYTLEVEAGASEIETHLPLEATESGQVIRRNRLIMVHNLAESAHYEQQLHQSGLRAAMIAPLSIRSGVIGTLTVASSQSNAFDQNDGNLLVQVATLVATAIESRRLFIEVEERAAELEVINRVAQAVSQQLDLDQLLGTVLGSVSQIMPVDSFIVSIYDKAVNRLRYPLVYDLDQYYQVAPASLKPNSQSYQVIQTGQPILNLYTAEELEALQQQSPATLGQTDALPASSMFVPLRVGKQVTGVLSVQSYSFDAYSAADMAVLAGIANHVAVALENVRLFTEAQRRADREHLVNEITRKIQGTTSMKGALQTAVHELGSALQAKNAQAILQPATKP